MSKGREWSIHHVYFVKAQFETSPAILNKEGQKHLVGDKTDEKSYS
jgi:hypothetical protein